MSRPTPRPLSLKARALALLAQREHSVIELRRKLLREMQAVARAAAAVAATAGPAAVASGDGTRGAGDVVSDLEAQRPRGRIDEADASEQVDAVIEWLRANRHLSEERFIESRVHVRAGRFGNLRIERELAQHGLTLPAAAASALKQSELERATGVLRRKFGHAAADLAERSRQSRFLAGRGFSPEIIRQVLRSADGASSALSEVLFDD